MKEMVSGYSLVMQQNNNLKLNKMPDISMCKGGSCLLRLNCHRYTATAEELGQSFFSEPPYKLNIMLDEHQASLGVATVGCAYFWNNEKYENERPKNKRGLGEGLS